MTPGQKKKLLKPFEFLLLKTYRTLANLTLIYIILAAIYYYREREPDIANSIEAGFFVYSYIWITRKVNKEFREWESGLKDISVKLNPQKNESRPPPESPGAGPAHEYLEPGPPSESFMAGTKLKSHGTGLTISEKKSENFEDFSCPSFKKLSKTWWEKITSRKKSVFIKRYKA